MRLVIVVTFVLLAAGCVNVPAGELDAASADAALSADPFHGLGDPLVVDHDHADLAAHALSTPSMEALARLTFGELGVPPVAFGEADLLGEDHLAIAGLLHGFYIADVSDPAAPVAVSYAPNPGFNADLKASESGNFVFLGVQLAGATGVQVWNVVVRERPVLTGFFPLEGGCHMLAVHESHLYCAPNDATVRIFEIVETPATAALVPVGVYAPMDVPAAPVVKGEDHGDEFTHDMTVQADPLTGEPVMYVSFWEYGLRVVDVSDPARPVELGAWLGDGSDVYEGNIHTSVGGLIGGKRVIVTVPEFATVPSVTIVDATDYAAMRALGVWAPKTAEELGDSANRFSTHNFQLVGERIYLAMYHGGVWVLDASDPARPTPRGYFLPADGAAAEIPTPVAFLGGGSPNTWDVVVKDGVILASDIVGGLYALHYVDDARDPSVTSIA